jgi:hypothetical protein
MQELRDIIAGLDVSSLVLLSMVLVMVFILWKTQQRADFDFSNMLRDDTVSDQYPKGKESIARICSGAAFIIHSWLLVHDATAKGWVYNKDEVFVYCVTWSGSLVLLKAIDAWKSKA